MKKEDAIKVVYTLYETSLFSVREALKALLPDLDWASRTPKPDYASSNQLFAVAQEVDRLMTHYWELLPDADTDSMDWTQMQMRYLGQYMGLEAVRDKITEVMKNGADAIPKEEEMLTALQAEYEKGKADTLAEGVTINTVMQCDDLDDLVPTCEDMAKYGFKEGEKVSVQIRRK